MLRILYEDNHLLAVAKPAGVATMGAVAGTTTLLDLAKEYLQKKYNKPGNVFLGVVSRLDAPVTGIVLFGRTSKASSRLSEAFRDRKVRKRYLACVEGEATDPDGPVVHHIRKDERNRRMHTTHAQAPGAQRAELQYRVLIAGGERSLVEVRLLTGRKHQIRVQMAKIGLPIVGDQKYGARTPYEPGIALHAWRLGVEHPVRHEPLELTDPPPKVWAKWFGGKLNESIDRAANDPSWPAF